MQLDSMANIGPVEKDLYEEDVTARTSHSHDPYIEHNKQQKSLVTALETQHSQLEQVNEIIQEQNEMITQLRDLYRVEIAKQINEVAQMKQFHREQV